jgi:hypothetical protein
MYPATSTLSLNSCTFFMNIEPNPRRTIISSVRPYFVPGRSSDKPRGNGNIAYLRHLVLDFERGELKPETLCKLFPDLRMVITNTYRHSPDKPRFRAVLFTDDPMTAEAYTLIYGWIADKLEQAGHSVSRGGRRPSNSRPSGLDWKKSCPTSLFYLPSQAEQRQLFQ